MITSVTFRHRTEYKLLRLKIEKECKQIFALMPDITSMHVVFDKEVHQKTPATSISCHISVHMKYKKHIDIYEYHRNEHLAFEQAFERINDYSHKLQAIQIRHDKLHLSHNKMEHFS